MFLNNKNNNNNSNDVAIGVKTLNSCECRICGIPHDFCSEQALGGRAVPRPPRIQEGRGSRSSIFVPTKPWFGR